MSGDATFAGTNYQASVIAYVFVHVLTETKLRWVALADDTPSAVSGEVRGPGDDARVEFRTGSAPVEIQAKHGLKPQKCIEAFEVRETREALEMSRHVFAFKLGVNPRTLERWEQGRSKERAGRCLDLVGAEIP